MNKIIAPLLSVFVALGLCAGTVGVFYAGRAEAQPAAVAIVDAGIPVNDAVVDRGLKIDDVGTVTGTTVLGDVTQPKYSETIDDPITAPGAYIDDAKVAKQTGWPLLVLVIGFGLCKILGRLGKSKAIPWLAFLGEGKAPFVIGAAGAVISALIDVIALGGTIVAAGYAALFALFGYFDTGGKKSDPTPPSTN